MNWDLIAPWLNRIGLLAGFISFWLVAPELIGEERLLSLESRAESYLGLLKDSNLSILDWLMGKDGQEGVWHKILHMDLDTKKLEQSGVFGALLAIFVQFIFLFFISIPFLILSTGLAYLYIRALDAVYTKGTASPWVTLGETASWLIPITLGIIISSSIFDNAMSLYAGD
jgi:hypothetical protein